MLIFHKCLLRRISLAINCLSGNNSASLFKRGQFQQAMCQQNRAFGFRCSRNHWVVSLKFKFLCPRRLFPPPPPTPSPPAIRSEYLRTYVRCFNLFTDLFQFIYYPAELLPIYDLCAAVSSINSQRPTCNRLSFSIFSGLNCSPGLFAIRTGSHAFIYDTFFYYSHRRLTLINNSPCSRVSLSSVDGRKCSLNQRQILWGSGIYTQRNRDILRFRYYTQRLKAKYCEV